MCSVTDTRCFTQAGHRAKYRVAYAALKKAHPESTISMRVALQRHGATAHTGRARPVPYDSIDRKEKSSGVATLNGRFPMILTACPVLVSSFSAAS